MGVILGVIGVLGSVLIGFMGPGGPVEVLFQPYEFVTIAGGIGFTILISSPGVVLKAIIPGVIGAIKGSGVTKALYKDILGLMACVFDTMRREGVLGIEGDISNPHQSAKFNRYPLASHNHHLMETLCGALRLFVDGVVNAFELDRLLDTEIETHLVGTMLGIFLSYGLIGPIGTKMEHNVREVTGILKCVKAGLVSFAGGAPPGVALEFARKTIPSAFRPTSEELEEILKEAKKK